MKQYVVDELRPVDYETLKAYLEPRFERSALSDIYLMTLDISLLTDEQRSHTSCHPLYVALHLKRNALMCELLIRTNERIRCDCMGYADRTQRDWIVGRVDEMFDALNIRI